jgi:hypothetical protein
MAASGAMGTEHQYANWAKALDPSKSNSKSENSKTTNEGKLKIKIDDKDKIDRNELNPPNKPRNAPTFKKDGSKVEIHHEGQNPKGPFKEMHKDDHRGKGNDSKNHPDKGKPSKVDRKEFDKARKEYWKEEYYPQNPK